MHETPAVGVTGLPNPHMYDTRDLQNMAFVISSPTIVVYWAVAVGNWRFRNFLIILN